MVFSWNQGLFRTYLRMRTFVEWISRTRTLRSTDLRGVRWLTLDDLNNTATGNGSTKLPEISPCAADVYVDEICTDQIRGTEIRIAEVLPSSRGARNLILTGLVD